MTRLNAKNVRVTKKDIIAQLYNKVVKDKVAIAKYIKEKGNTGTFEDIDTNRFTQYVFSETGFKPTTIERILRNLKRYDRN